MIVCGIKIKTEIILLLKQKNNDMILANYMKNCVIYLLLSSCLYKAGNRQSDLNLSIPISVNTFYVDNYLRQKWMKTNYESPLNSELVNYPQDFVPLTNTLNGLKYVIELRVSGDSSKNNGWGLILSSIYDLKKKKWITSRDSLTNGELEKFKLFFRDSILEKAVERYKNKIPDSLLFIGKPDTIIFKPPK